MTAVQWLVTVASGLAVFMVLVAFGVWLLQVAHAASEMAAAEEELEAPVGPVDWADWGWISDEVDAA